MTGKLVLIGSGEVAPGMVGLHRRLLKDLGPKPRAAFLDTPAGFELGLGAIHARFSDYFLQRLDVEFGLASYRSADEPAASIGAALEVIRRADYLIAGPGSPSYAIRHWRGSAVFAALVERWRAGATLVFASSAAVAIGRLALPVYEIYKVGEPLHWRRPGARARSNCNAEVVRKPWPPVLAAKAATLCLRHALPAVTEDV